MNLRTRLMSKPFIVAILFCLYLAETANASWTGTWAPLNPQGVGFPGDYGNCGGIPCPRNWVPGAFDTKRNVLAIFGGGPAGGCDSGYINDFWTFDYSQKKWTEILPVKRASDGANNLTWPAGRDNHMLAYDKFQDLYWMFGGTCTDIGNGVVEQAIWSFNRSANTWTKYPAPYGVIPNNMWGRYDSIFAFDENSRKIILFGGELNGQRTNDTWEFDTVSHAWLQTNVNGAPNAPAQRYQCQNCAAYDPVTKKTVMFGGWGLGGVLNDLWTYDSNAHVWSEITPVGSLPPPRMIHAVALDTKRHLFIIAGGQNESTSLGDSWIYDFSTNTWTKLAGSVGGGAHQTAGYDPANDVVLVYEKSSTFALSMSGSGGGGGNQVPIPTVQDEKATYQKWSWTWGANQDSGAITEPVANYQIYDPDIHGDTEGDDLWTYLAMYRRTGNAIYLNRASAWARYFKSDYAQCSGGATYTYCYDRDGYGADHFYGWGLIDWYQYTCSTNACDADALTAINLLGAQLENLYGPNTPFACLPNGTCTTYGLRQQARHLLFITRLAELDPSTRWITLRDRVLSLLMSASPEWDASRGMYFLGEWSTDQEIYPGAWAAGARIQSAFQIGILAEAFYQIYRTTGRGDVKDRIVSMARFVNQYGLDDTYQYTGSRFGIVNGVKWHNYAQYNPVTYWDPVYSTSLVNTLVYGYKLSGDLGLLNQAKNYFNRGTKGIYGSPTARAAGDNQVAHFIDTRFASSYGYIYLDYNKGELQYTYQIFENGGNPIVTVDVPPTQNVVPVVNAGPDQTITLPGVASLVATVSDDGLPNPPGAVSTTWSKMSGPGTVTFVDANARSTTANFSVAGSYVLRLTGNDSALQASDDVSITVNPGVTNQAPSVNAGPDQTITLPASAILNGTASDDGLPTNSLTTTWSIVTGPGTVTFANASSAKTTATFSASGAYVLNLKASDGTLTASDDVLILVNPVPVVKDFIDIKTDANPAIKVTRCRNDTCQRNMQVRKSDKLTINGTPQ